MKKRREFLKKSAHACAAAVAASATGLGNLSSANQSMSEKLVLLPGGWWKQISSARTLSSRILNSRPRRWVGRRRCWLFDLDV